MQFEKLNYKSELKRMRINLDSLPSIGIDRATHRRILADFRALKKLLMSVSERKIEVSLDLDAGCIRIIQDFNFKCEHVFPKKMVVEGKSSKMFKKLAAQSIYLEVEKVRKDISKLIRKKISQKRIN